MSEEPARLAARADLGAPPRQAYKAREILQTDQPMTQPDLSERLEAEGLLMLEGSPFEIRAAERPLLTPAVSAGHAKNISLGPRGGSVSGAAPDADIAAIGALMARFTDWAEGRVAATAPAYVPTLERGRTSFRVLGVTAPPSRRKDDRRLHVDAFASQPTGGRRILRVFCNIDPDGLPRRWRVGEAFESHAGHFLNRLRRPLPGEASLLRLLGVTKARRTPYDALMLGLHDAAKLDDAYQAAAPFTPVEFAAGAAWMVFTDQVPHAAMAGRFLLEQTFYLPVSAMRRPETAPLRILERLEGRRLV